MKNWQDMTLDEKTDYCNNRSCFDCKYVVECHKEFGDYYAPCFVPQNKKGDKE